MNEQNRRRLPGSDLVLSRIAFGTASLHRLRHARDRRAVLEAAAENGLTHFDTAPVYGFGLAERELAPLLASEPGLTVATKVGLYAPGGSDQSRHAMLCRKALGKIFPSLSRARADLSVRSAEASFDRSLTRLQRDHVDILFVHEPDHRLLTTDEWLAWLEKEKRRGRLKSAGLAGAASRMEPFVLEASPLAEIVQSSDSLEGREADFMLRAGRPLQITFGYMSAAIRTGRPYDPEQIILNALDRNPTGSILVSTRHVDRIPVFSAALASFNQRHRP